MNTAIWIPFALGKLGTAEIVGDKDNPDIVEFHQATGLKAQDDETAWCGAFVAWSLQKAKVPYNAAHAASARSWLSFGQPLTTPRPGCVVVFWRGSRTAATGHVAFYIGEDDKGRVWVLGGNQGNSVSIAPYPKDRVLGYRWP